MKPNNEPAFPIQKQQYTSQGFIQPAEFFSGMTLRDYYAIHAPEKEIDFLLPQCNSGETLETICRTRYKYADAMLLERNKQP